MLPVNYWLAFVVALIPFVVGAIWYGPLFGKTWQGLVGLSDEKIQSANMLKTMGLAYVFAFIICLMLQMVVIHQYGLSGMFGMLPEWADKSSGLWADLNVLNDKYGMYTRHMHFGHGALHGGIFGLLFVGPILATHANFAQQNWKLPAIHTGYWIVTLALAGGVLCQFIKLPLG